ncbi:MAG: ArsA-related P-loop ATPase [Myxococcota bacterium]
MLKPLWDSREIIVAVGTGGVGKTTASASIAIAAAAAGKKTLVMTIDPSRRLAHALGIDADGNTEQELSVEELSRSGIDVEQSLWAMIPDVKTTFDRLVERFAPDAERREAIMQNRIYKHFSSALAGSLEYAAVERLYEIHASGRYDLIVLDTPPSQNVVEFLDAPSRILDFLEQETLQWLVKPYSLAGRFSVKLLDLGSSFILKTLGRLAGADTLRELAEFIMSFQGMYDGFRERSEAVRSLLRSPSVAFVLVGSTARFQHRAMVEFRRQLHQEGISVRSVVLNRVRPPLEKNSSQQAILDRVERVLEDRPGSARHEVIAAAREELILAKRDQEAIDATKLEFPELPLITLPELVTDVRDLEALALLYREFLEHVPLDVGTDTDSGKN